MIESPNYIYLQRYNIESYYIDEKAVLKFMAGKLKKTQKVVSEQINYSEWKAMAYKAMKKLFINFMVAQAAFPEEKNVGLPEHSFFYKNGYANNEKINKYIMSLKCRMLDYEVKYERNIKCFETILSGDEARLICGKYYEC